MPIRVRVGNRMVSGAVYKRMRTQLRRRKARRGMGGAKSSFAKRVMAVVRRQEETKYVATDNDATGAPHGPVWYASPNIVNINSVSPAIPALVNGTGDFQRIGQKINPSSLYVNLRIGFNPTDLSANSLIGVIYYGTTTQSGSWANANPLPTSAFLDNGDGTNSVWTGLRNQLNLPTDRTLVKVKRITFRLSKSEGWQNGDNAPGPGGLNGNYSTSNGLSEKNFVLKFKPPKTLVYNMIADSLPQNYAPFYYVGFCHADGSPVGVADRTLVNISSRVHMRFKDA
jgi:hypothetical protein